MKKSLLPLLLILLFKISYSQDTLYLDQNFKATQKVTANYFEIVSPTNNAFEVDFYSMSHELLSKETYLDKTLKTLDGPAIFYYQNGNKDSEGAYINNKREGTWKFYFYSGQLSAVAEFKDDKSIKESYYDLHGLPFKDSTIAFHEPTFNGGVQALYKYISQNFRIPNDLRNIHGKITVAFVIDRDGHVTDVRIDKSLNEKLDQEAVRVVNSLPDWKPGIQFNRPVRVQYLVPIGI